MKKGQLVIVRADEAGVFRGEFVSMKAVGHSVIVELNKSVRLWSWEGNGGVALSGVAVHGLKGGRLDSEIPKGHLIFNPCEIIPCVE